MELEAKFPEDSVSKWNRFLNLFSKMCFGGGRWGGLGDRILANSSPARFSCQWILETSCLSCPSEMDDDGITTQKAQNLAVEKIN